MTDILHVTGLSKSFGGLMAVNNVDLSVKRNTIHALIGPNGAGKTTLFNLLTKYFAPTSGRIMFEGIDITNLTSAQIARMGMVRSFQISAVFPQISALENVRIALQRRMRGSSFDFWRSDRCLQPLNEQAQSILEEVGIGRVAETNAGDLPYGQKRTLEIATTVAIDPKMMLLDEPMAGLGHEDIARISELIRRLARNRTILMVEHNLSVVSELSDRITVLARGKVIADGSYENVSTKPEVIQSYIGGVDA